MDVNLHRGQLVLVMLNLGEIRVSFLVCVHRLCIEYNKCLFVIEFYDGIELVLVYYLFLCTRSLLNLVCDG